MHWTLQIHFACISFLWQLHLGLNMYCFIVLSILRHYNYIYRSRNFRFGSSLRRWRQKVWRKMTSRRKMTSKHQNRHPDIMHERVVLYPYTPTLCKTTLIFLAPVVFTEILVCYARKGNLIGIGEISTRGNFVMFGFPISTMDWLMLILPLFSQPFICQW